MYPGLTEGRRALRGVWEILAETCVYCTILDSSALSAIVFRFLLLQKEPGRGEEAHYYVRSTVTPHGVRQKEKALRGEEGENKSFPTSNTTSLYKSYFKTVHWTVFEESLIKW